MGSRCPYLEQQRFCIQLMRQTPAISNWLNISKHFDLVQTVTRKVDAVTTRFAFYLEGVVPEGLIAASARALETNIVDRILSHP
eukprot:5061311-Amphidinium_carterae.1